MQNRWTIPWQNQRLHRASALNSWYPHHISWSYLIACFPCLSHFLSGGQNPAPMALFILGRSLIVSPIVRILLSCRLNMQQMIIRATKWQWLLSLKCLTFCRVNVLLYFELCNALLKIVAGLHTPAEILSSIIFAVDLQICGDLSTEIGAAMFAILSTAQMNKSALCSRIVSQFTIVNFIPRYHPTLISVFIRVNYLHKNRHGFRVWKL